jgi:hypothetical protein
MGCVHPVNFRVLGLENEIYYVDLVRHSILPWKRQTPHCTGSKLC